MCLNKKAIPAHRKADVAIILKDVSGHIMANTPVTVRQLRHKFLFGCNIFPLDEQDTSESQRAYQEQFAVLFNYATLPFYWGSYETTEGHTDENRLRRMAKWCLDRGIAPKGHPLCWHDVAPAWRVGKSLDEMRALQMNRITREVSRFKGIIDVWDVLNEAVAMPYFVRAENHMTEIVKRDGVVPIIKEAFARARDANPEATLLLNDYDNNQPFAQIVEQCLEAGVSIDAIGLQSHMHRGYMGRESVMGICKLFAQFGKPLHWTEVTLISGDARPENDFHTRIEDWHSTLEGEERQAKEVVDLYTSLFAHPSVEAVTWWDLTDGIWIGAPGGLLRENMSPKPAYKQLTNLIKGEWWSGEETLTTDPSGNIRFSGVRGDYEIAAFGKRALFMLDHSGPLEIIFGR
jgi:GH35 family endo-1,4-beta-xylanase